ncbi:MAG TPA: dUTP diphosphatase [Bacteroidales bacterium]|nr:dUTP diphosphatase [Bacteroidales bacterium]
MIVRVINKSKHELPDYETTHSAGMDVRANLVSEVSIRAGERVLIPTGLFIELPEGFEAQIRPRSGLAIKHGITVLNSPGTIDADYRGEIKVILINLSDKDFVIKDGERICQMIVSRFEKISWKIADAIDNTLRGEGGFGHTGV